VHLDFDYVTSFEVSSPYAVHLVFDYVTCHEDYGIGFEYSLEILMCFHVLRIRTPLRLRVRNTNPERTLFLLPPSQS
jgi:hypothetical protein